MEMEKDAKRQSYQQKPKENFQIYQEVNILPQYLFHRMKAPYSLLPRSP